jgi:2-keto-4-pentenoate hydratase/2-oxohepta-3-ene-1,7-dioic acid hydratase in catechol pathway
MAPIEPTQILGIGLNYKKHAEETNMPIPKFPVVFYKNKNSIQHPNGSILIPSIARTPEQVDFEVELAIIIGQTCKNISEKDALQYILGYTIANDISARKWQGKQGGNQWCRAKSFDKFCPLGRNRYGY